MVKMAYLSREEGWVSLYNYKWDVESLAALAEAALATFHTCLNNKAVHGDLSAGNIFVRYHIFRNPFLSSLIHARSKTNGYASAKCKSRIMWTSVTAMLVVYSSAALEIMIRLETEITHVHELVRAQNVGCCNCQIAGHSATREGLASAHHVCIWHHDTGSAGPAAAAGWQRQQMGMQRTTGCRHRLPSWTLPGQGQRAKPATRPS